MGRFSRLRQNKKFGYKPRYYDDKGEGSPYKIERKLDKLRMLVIIAILVLIFLYIIDFDLSIFFKG